MGHLIRITKWIFVSLNNPVFSFDPVGLCESSITKTKIKNKNKNANKNSIMAEVRRFVNIYWLNTYDIAVFETRFNFKKRSHKEKETKKGVCFRCWSWLSLGSRCKERAPTRIPEGVLLGCQRINTYWNTDHELKRFCYFAIGGKLVMIMEKIFNWMSQSA